MTSSRSVRRPAPRIGLAAMCGALLTGVIAGSAQPASAAPPQPDAPQVAVAVPMLDWQPCENGFFCATATVPLDYAHPTGATVQLAVIKRPATDPAHRIGSVFFSPGGPHEGGATQLPELYSLFPPALRARFDVVSWDQRGLGQSTDLQCFDSIDQENQLLAGLPVPYPQDAAQDQVWEDIAGRFDSACATHAGPLLAHDTTADTARDLDLLRQAVGDPTMNYLGASYGSYVGATYANLFPTKVRALTLDGDVDPVAWATGTDGSADRLGTFLRMGTDKATAAALNQFLDLCGRAATSSCAFSAGSPAATRAKWNTLLDRLASHPVTLAGNAITRAVAVDDTSNALPAPLPIPNLRSGWPGLASFLQSVWAQTNGGPAPAGNALSFQDVMSPDTPYRGIEVHWGVDCSDSPNPRNPASYPEQAAFAAARSGVVGPDVAWSTEICAQWPVLSPDRYTGPWNHPTAAPILVVGNTGDPSTPYAGAIAMSHDLANARLLTVDGYGHTAFLNHSGCVDDAEDAYFVTGALPRPGTVCRQDQVPFAG
jgi:pimeloyl-ACP methyl ester carboxylesterase